MDSDYLRIRPDLKTLRDPYGGMEYVVVPPIIPDWAIISATKGDRNGGITTLSGRSDRVLAMAARKTIAVVEELVEPDQVLPGLHEVYCAPVHIDAVVLAPGGAHPTDCPGRYAIDAAHMAAYVAAAKDESSFQAYLETYILEPRDHAAYLAKVGFKTHGK